MTSDARSRGAESLSNRQVHVWHARPGDVHDASHVSGLLALLSEDERARHQRFWFDRDRHHFLVAHALVRTTLSRYADVRPETWTFETNRYGRPEITGPETSASLRFNLSHTTGLVVCAVVRDREIGVDVEDTRREDASLKIARRFFSPAEVADLEQVPTTRQRESFFDYWTLKEAYIKARGMGLAIPLRHFSFTLDEHQPIRIAFAPELDDDPARWQFAQLRPTDTHLVSVAVERDDDASDLDIVPRGIVPEV